MEIVPTKRRNYDFETIYGLMLAKRLKYRNKREGEGQKIIFG